MYDDFAARLVKRVNAFKVGDPMIEGINIGPLVNERGVAKVDRHVHDAVALGAKIAAGGKRLTGPGYDGGNFYAPTVLVNVPLQCAIADEETFGPLAALFSFENEDDVIKRANNVEVGLAGYFYTKDVSRTYRVAEKMQVGMVAVGL